ncbi:hypothetical protein D1872_302830 [compost metagenome]
MHDHQIGIGMRLFRMQNPEFLAIYLYLVTIFERDVGIGKRFVCPLEISGEPLKNRIPLLRFTRFDLLNHIFMCIDFQFWILFK